MINITRHYLKTPTDWLFFIYNLSVSLFIVFNLPVITNGLLLISTHLIIITLYIYLSSLNLNNENAIKLNNYIKIFFIISSLTFLHYESGLINLVIFPDYFDESIKALDLKLFGFPVYRLAEKYLRHNLIAQTFHLFYMTYYFILIIPLLLIYRKHSATHLSFSGPTEKSMFLLLFTMFTCYWVFIIFPVAGPTDVHYKIFEGYGGFVKLINLLYEHGDSAGGAMPSSHVSVSLVVTLFSFKYLKNLAPYILICFIMLTLSTVYCSFHYGIDAIAGVLVGLVLYYLGRYIHFQLKGKLKVNK